MRIRIILLALILVAAVAIAGIAGLLFATMGADGKAVAAVAGSSFVAAFGLSLGALSFVLNATQQDQSRPRRGAGSVR